MSDASNIPPPPVVPPAPVPEFPLIPPAVTELSQQAEPEEKAVYVGFEIKGRIKITDDYPFHEAIRDAKSLVEYGRQFDSDATCLIDTSQLPVHLEL